jgi:hypothetical protein
MHDEAIIINKRTQCSVCDNKTLITIMNILEKQITGLSSKEKRISHFKLNILVILITFTTLQYLLLQ